MAEPTTAFTEFISDRIGGSEIEKDMRCNDCGSRWLETYKLTEVQILQRPRECGIFP